MENTIQKSKNSPLSESSNVEVFNSLRIPEGIEPSEVVRYLEAIDTVTNAGLQGFIKEESYE